MLIGCLLLKYGRKKVVILMQRVVGICSSHLLNSGNWFGRNRIRNQLQSISFSTIVGKDSSEDVKSITGSKPIKKIAREHVKIELREEDLYEIFSRSSGPGGQNVNKTNSKVQLTHIPSNITVTCQEQRDLSINRKIARKKLIDQLDLMYNGTSSKLSKKSQKIKRRKSKSNKRSKLKYGTKDGAEIKETDNSDDDDSEDDGDNDEDECENIKGKEGPDISK